MTSPINWKSDLQRESAISPDIIKEAGLGLNDFSRTGICGEGIDFPYPEGNGSRVRLFEPRKNKDGKIQKYSSLKGNTCDLYFLQKHYESIFRTNAELIGVEGEKKLLSSASIKEIQDVPMISYPGANNWTKAGSGGQLSENWSHIPFAGRVVKLCPDSDFFSNYDVYQGVIKLIKAIIEKGGIVKLYDLRLDGVEEKVGVDDFIVKNGSQAFLDVLSSEPHWTFQYINIEDFNIENREEFYQSLVLLDKSDVLEMFDDMLALKVKGFKKSTAEAKWKKYKKKWNKNKPRQRVHDNALIWYHMEEDIKSFIDKLSPKISELDNLYRNEGTSTFLTILSNSKMQSFPRSKELSSYLGNFFSIKKASMKDGEVSFGPNEYLNEKLIDTFKDLPLNYQSIKEVSFVTNTPQLHGERVISKFGYDDESKIFYTGKNVEEKHEFRYLDEFLSMFPFESTVDSVNVLGLILSFFVINNYKGQHPSIIIQGDKQNLGKTTLAECLSILFQEDEPSTIALTYDEELKKTISSVLQSNNVALIDNIKNSKQSAISSPFLESLITSTKISIRILGENKMFERQNNVLVIFTLNGGSFSLDLTTRSLYIALTAKQSNKINFDKNPKDFVKKNRNNILGEALHLILNYLSKTDKNASNKKYPNFKFNLWAKQIDEILTANGFTGFLENQQHLKDKHDPFRDSVEEFLVRLDVFDMESGLKPHEVLDRLNPEIFEDSKNIRSRSMKLSQFFKDNPEIQIEESVYTIQKVPDPSSGGQSKKYKFTRRSIGTSEPY